MAIKRYVAKPVPFDFDGMQVGLRRPTVDQMIAISAKRSVYVRTLQDSMREEIENPSGLPAEGDTEKLFELQKLIAEMLCCDPDNINESWFAKTPEEAKAADKNLVGEMPQGFFAAAFDCFVKITNVETEKKPDEAANANVPLSRTTETTTSDSAGSNSPSASA